MLATDGGNTWVAAWDATEDAGSGMQTLRKIFVTRSADGGANWATPVAVSEELPFNTRSNYEPCIGTDGAGVWVVVWEGRGTGPLINERDSDLIFARSTDNGATWSAPAVLNSNAATDTKQDQRPRLATDKAGKWMVAWMAYGTNEMTVPYSPASDIYVARSADNGATWQAPMLVSTTGVPTDRTFDNYPAIVFAGSAKPRLKGSFSYDAGATWTAPGLLTSDPAGGGTRPVPAGAAASGRTLVAWPTGSDSRAGDYYHMFLDATTAGINDWMLW
jgi:Neuraminidase (sialidase)